MARHAHNDGTEPPCVGGVAPSGHQRRLRVAVEPEIFEVGQGSPSPGPPGRTGPYGPGIGDLCPYRPQPGRVDPGHEYPHRYSSNREWVAATFGKRSAADITFALEPTFDAHRIGFVHAEATAIDPASRTVSTAAGSYGYDYLVVATGFRNKFDVAPGLGPDGYAQTITTLADAERAGTAWRKFLDDPGPVVIGATQGASCFGAAYEFLFNTSHQLRKAKLHDKASLTFITSEPFAGHFGIGGLPGGEKLLNMFLKKEGITALTGVAFEEVTGGRIKLTDGTAVPFRYAMVVPPFAVQDFVL